MRGFLKQFRAPALALITTLVGCGDSSGADDERAYERVVIAHEAPEALVALSQEGDRPTLDRSIDELVSFDTWLGEESVEEVIPLVSPETALPDPPNRGWDTSVVFHGNKTVPIPDYPEGKMSFGLLVHEGRMCTATLIAPNMAISAAHCVGFTSEPNTDALKVVFFAGGGRLVVSSKRWVSFGTQAGPADVVLIQLATPVPPHVATPKRLASLRGPSVSEGTLHGFGCDNLTQTNRWLLRWAPISRTEGLGPVAKLCPADAGGPLMDPSGREIVGVASGTYAQGEHAGGPAIASIALVYERLVAQQTAWIQGCYSHTLERPVAEGVCLQRQDRTCASEDPCAWVSCTAGKWRCQGARASDCGDARQVPNLQCAAPEASPPAGPAGCESTQLGQRVPHGTCVQSEVEVCGGGCRWIVCRDGGWVCPEKGNLACATAALYPSAQCIR